VRHYSFAPRRGDIAFTATAHHGLTGTHIYLLKGGRGRPRQVSDAEVHDGPVWSPDGRWLVFSTDHGEIERVHPDGSGEQTIAEAFPEEVEWLAFSPDGRQLLYGAHTPSSDGLGYERNGGGSD
jgi:Tol biopolymer transport system component